MKPQKKLWIRLIDGFLPKDQQKLPVIDMFRRRALVRTVLFGALFNPCIFLADSAARDPWQRAGIALILVVVPFLLVWLFRSTARLKLCAGLFLLYSTLLCAWVQREAATILAPYWMWVPFMVVFAVLVIGVKEGTIFTLLVTLLFAMVLQESVPHGSTVGRYLEPEALLSSIVLQVLLIQVSFIMFMTAYDVVRNRAEVRAVLLRFTDDEAARLASIGERMGGMAQDLNAELKEFQQQLAALDGLAKRSDTKVEDLQNAMRDLQEKTQKLSVISQRAQG